MPGVVAYVPEDFRLEEIEVPTPGPSEILAKVGACGICDSDVTAFKGAANYWGGPGKIGRAHV